MTSPTCHAELVSARHAELVSARHAELVSARHAELVSATKKNRADALFFFTTVT